MSESIPSWGHEHQGVPTTKATPSNEKGRAALEGGSQSTKTARNTKTHTCSATCTGCTPSSLSIHSSVVWNTRGREHRYGTFSFFNASTALGASCRAGPPTSAKPAEHSAVSW